jgi:phage gp36-like protein
MSTYTTIAELQKRLDPLILAGLADDINSPPQIGAAETVANLTQAINDGAALIDSYLLGRVDLASSAVQTALERINATLALYFLYRRRYLSDAQNPLAAARDLATAQLAAVAGGAVKIADGADGEPQSAAFSTTEGVEKKVDSAALERF